MKSQVVKRSIVIDGHKTSVSLEDAFWAGLRKSRRHNRRRCRSWSEKSTERANKATYLQRSDCSYSIKSVRLDKRGE